MVKNLTKMAVVGMIGVALALSAQPAMAQNTVAYIRNSGAGDYATHDKNIIDVLGTTGTVINGTVIPGLNYTIVEYQHGTEPLPITEDLCFISQTVSSGTPLRHTTDTVPLINTEAALNDDGGTQSDLYFSNSQSGRTGATEITITDNSHPITAIFPVGYPIRIFDNPNGNAQLGVMYGGLGGGVTPLAVRSDNTGETALAVADTGATPLRSGAPAGADPTPARRVCIGFHQNSMVNPTVAGVILLQRTVQWAMGDTVTANAPLSYGEVTRDLGGTGATGATYTPSGAFSYDLVLDALGADNFQTTDTVPAGFTINSVSAPIGTATFAGQVVSWSGAFATTGVTRCTVNLTAPASGSHQWPADSPFVVGASVGITTSYYKHGARWDDAPEGYWVNEVGAAPNTSGLPLIDADFENCSQLGATSYIDKGTPGPTVDDVWIMRGSGNQFWSSGDDYHMTYMLVEGDFDVTARVRLHAPGPYQETRLGLFARNIDLGNNDPALSGGVIWNKNNFGIAQIRRANDGGGIGRSDRVEDEPRADGDAILRITRVGSETRFYFNRNPDIYTTFTEPNANANYITDVALNNVVALGIGGSAGEEDGDPQGYFEAEYTEFDATATPYTVPVSGANRVLSTASVVPGDTVGVTINLPHAADATTLTVVENLPPGHGAYVSNISNGGVVSGDTITWTLTPFTATAALTYDLQTRFTQGYLPYLFTNASWSDADGYGEMIPDSSLPQQGVVALFQDGAYPDPSYTGCADTGILFYQPNNNDGADDVNEEGDWRGTGDGNGLDDHKKLLVKFDLSSVPDTTVVTSAVLGIYLYDERRADYRDPHDISVYPILKQWNEGRGAGTDGSAAQGDEVTYNDVNTTGAGAYVPWEIAGAMGNTDVGPLESTTPWNATWPEFVHLDVSASVQSMVSTAGPDDDQGWKISQDKVRGQADDQAGNEYTATGAYGMLSSDQSDVLRRPYLAFLDGSQYAPAVGSAVRSTTAATYTWGVPLTVTIDVQNLGNSAGLTIFEPLPDGITSPSISNAGTGVIDNSGITWTITPFNANAQVTYDVTVPDSFYAQYRYARVPLAFGQGTAEDAAGGGALIAPTMIMHSDTLVYQDGQWNGDAPDPAYAGTDDAFVIVYQGDNNMGAHNRLEEGDWNGGTGDHKKILIKFAGVGPGMPTITDENDIGAAYLLLYGERERRGITPNESHFIRAQRVLKDWNEGRGTGDNGVAALADEVTWNNANVGADTGTTVPWEIAGVMGLSDVGTSEPETLWDVAQFTGQDIPGWVPLDVTATVKEIVQSGLNYGWKVSQDVVMGVPDNDAANAYKMGAYGVVASENADVAHRPMLVIHHANLVPVSVSKFELH